MCIKEWQKTRTAVERMALGFIRLEPTYEVSKPRSITRTTEYVVELVLTTSD